MPTVIALLNSYAGLSASAMGFVLNNKLLIVAGASGRLVGLYSLDHHVPRHEPLVHQRSVRRVRPIADQGGYAGSPALPFRQRRRSRADSGFGAQHRGHSRLRHGGGAGAAQASRNVRRPDQARRECRVRHSSGGRTHARPHERAAGRGRRALRQAARDGRHQPRDVQRRRGADHRRQRRRQSGGRDRSRTAPSPGCPSSRPTRRAP